jgi:hypothetical protein
VPTRESGLIGEAVKIWKNHWTSRRDAHAIAVGSERMSRGSVMTSVASPSGAPAIFARPARRDQKVRSPSWPSPMRTRRRAQPSMSRTSSWHTYNKNLANLFFIIGYFLKTK